MGQRTVKPKGVRLRERVVAALADPASDVLSDAALASKLGLAEDALVAMVTDELLAEAMARRVAAVEDVDLAEVDRAMLQRAREGHVGAARLLYARVAARGEQDDGAMPSLDELEEMVRELKQREVS